MTQPMTPSTITAGQIGKLQELLGAALRKSNFHSEPIQQVLETQGNPLVVEWIAYLQKRVDAVSNLIIRHVKVNHTRTPQQVLDATGRKQYVNVSVVKTMPKGEGEEADIYFFHLGRYVSDADLEKEYELRGLKPADPYSLAQVNTDDPAFADIHPNGTHWQNAGKWCFATFGHWYGERRVRVLEHDGGWDDDWWFAGVRK